MRRVIIWLPVDIQNYEDVAFQIISVVLACTYQKIKLHLIDTVREYIKFYHEKYDRSRHLSSLPVITFIFYPQYMYITKYIGTMDTNMSLLFHIS
jgi:hypothetical protein